MLHRNRPFSYLTGMATRTLKAKFEVQDDSVSHLRVILCHAQNIKEAYYQFEDEADVPEEVAVVETMSVGPS